MPRSVIIIMMIIIIRWSWWVDIRAQSTYLQGVISSICRCYCAYKNVSIDPKFTLNYRRLINTSTINLITVQFVHTWRTVVVIGIDSMEEEEGGVGELRW